MSSVHVLFDITGEMATMTGLPLGTIEKKIKLSLKEPKHIKKMFFLEYNLPSTNGAKLVFTWEQWGLKEQFFRIEQYYPFPGNRPAPIDYKPWTQIASWSYISKPTVGTLQKNNIYENYFYTSQVPEIGKISFEVRGAPCGDWNTTDCEKGYWF